MNRIATASALLFLIACTQSPTEPTATAARVQDATSQTMRSRASRVARVLPPSCSDAAPLEIVGCPAPGYIVVLKPGTDPDATSAMFAARFGFTVRTVYTEQGTGYPGFYAIISAEAVAQLRCESSVKYIAENGYAGVGIAAPCR